MRRVGFYILVALLTFGIGSFLALKLFSESNSQISVSPETLRSVLNKPNTKLTFPKVSESLSQSEIPTKLFCNDGKILPVWGHLIKDKSFKDWEVSERGSLDCADMLEIKEIDLNQHGNKEILLRGKNSNLCSAVGNCAFWIYEKQGKTYKKLLSSNDHSDITKLGNQLLKTKTKGYVDILLKGHLSVSDTFYYFYKFNGKEYQQGKSLVNACTVCVGDNPKWKFMTLDEYDKTISR